jgi:hypothetical protein
VSRRLEELKGKDGVARGSLSNIETKSDVTAKGAENLAYVSHKEPRLQLDWKLRRFPAGRRSERQDGVAEAKLEAK